MLLKQHSTHELPDSFESHFVDRRSTRYPPLHDLPPKQCLRTLKPLRAPRCRMACQGPHKHASCCWVFQPPVACVQVFHVRLVISCVQPQNSFDFHTVLVHLGAAVADCQPVLRGEIQIAVVAKRAHHLVVVPRRCTSTTSHSMCGLASKRRPHHRRPACAVPHPP